MKLPDDERILIVRPCLKTICLDVRPAAKLLSLLLFYARNCSEQEVTYTFSCTQEDLIEGLIDEMDVKTLHRIAIPMLRLLGYLDVDGSSYRYQYTVHLDLIQHVLLHYKDRKQLDKILIVSMKWQLEKCLIQIDKSPIELVKCPIELDKLLIPFRQMSNSKRGRKPRPQVPLGDVSEEDRLLQIDSDITDKEESNSEHTDTDTFAPPDVGALSQFSLTEAIFFLRKHNYTIEPFAQRKDVFVLRYPSGKEVYISAENIITEANAVALGEAFDTARADSLQDEGVFTDEKPQGDDYAQPLQPLPTANHSHRGSGDVPSRDSQVDSTGAPSTLDAPPVDRAQGSDAVGGERRRGVAEDTASGIGSRTRGETGAARNTVRGQITEGDDHAHISAGNALWDGALPASSGDRNVPALDDRQVAAPEARPVLEAKQKEIDIEGDDHDLVDMDATDRGQHNGTGDTLHRVWADVRGLPAEQEVARADEEIGQTSPREDVPVMAVSPLDASTVEPGESGRDTLPGAPVSAQQGDDMFNQPQMHVLVTSQQFTSVEEWEQGRKDFHQTLSHAWKTANPDFKQQFGDWYGYRKHYGARWLKANPKPADVLPPDVQRILDDWKSLHRKVVPITKSDIDAATLLAPCTPTKEELSACRQWHFTTDDPKKPWYRKIGVSLMDLAKNWSKWQSLQDADDSRNETKTTTRTLTREELKRMPV